MDTAVNTMLSALEANGVLHLTLAQVGDLQDVDRRIKFGDESGWRGDPTMCVCIDKRTGMFEVWGLDNRGVEYKAASHTHCNHELVRKLRDSDPRTHDVGAEVLAHNEKLAAANAAKDRERFAEFADRMAWAIRQDFATELGGRNRPMTVARKIGA